MPAEPPADRDNFAFRESSRAVNLAAVFKKEEFAKSQVGVASIRSVVTPCNMSVDQLPVDGSDKNMPGCLMAMRLLKRPSRSKSSLFELDPFL